ERTVATARPGLTRARRQRQAVLVTTIVLATLDRWAQDGQRDRQLTVELATMIKAYLGTRGSGPPATRRLS
ncbi:MAG TPA: hypothetical protein VKG43_14025, partial [Acidimicrobiales bacterium]|nr:hypothetical protein [Acidimicrobiales bacterium]